MKKITLLLSILYCCIANAQYSKILDFSGGNGNNPYGDLISDGTYLYGLTYAGGNIGVGNIFRIKPDGTGYFMLHQFSGGQNGYHPYGSLLSVGSYLYGMTSYGGVSSGGFGTIFKIKPDGTGYVEMLSFSGPSSLNGSQPKGSLITDGTYLYGMTTSGGTNSTGIVFKIKPDGTGFSKLLDFTGPNGGGPNGSLIYDGTFLYGIAGGGANSKGVVFKIKTDGTGYLKLYDFLGGTDGSTPLGSLVSDGTFLYGMTQVGGANNGGIIFKIMPNGTGYTKMYDFNGTPGGFFPCGSLISVGGFLYGMTTNGPGASNCGTIFKIKSDGTGYVTMFGCSPPNGSQPNGSLLSDGTFLYGMTKFGGTGNTSCAAGDGTVFKIGINTVGIDENHPATDLNISPNPTNGVFQIKSEVFQIVNIEIYNVIGENIFSITNKNFQTSVSVDLSEQQSGIYFIKIIYPDGNYSAKKIIKE